MAGEFTGKYQPPTIVLRENMTGEPDGYDDAVDICEKITAELRRLGYADDEIAKFRVVGYDRNNAKNARFTLPASGDEAMLPSYPQPFWEMCRELARPRGDGTAYDAAMYRYAFYPETAQPTISVCRPDAFEFGPIGAVEVMKGGLDVLSAAVLVVELTPYNESVAYKYAGTEDDN